MALKQKEAYRILTSQDFQDEIRAWFEDSRVQSEADLRWRVAEYLERLVYDSERINFWQIHTEIPIRVKVGMTVKTKKPDVIACTEIGGPVKVAIELKVFKSIPSKKSLKKDVDTLRALSNSPTIEMGCLLYAFPEDKWNGKPIINTRSNWAKDYLLEIPFPMPNQIIKVYKRPWKWK